MENPKLPPILVNKAGSVYYVYTYKNVWDRELKRSMLIPELMHRAIQS